MAAGGWRLAAGGWRLAAGGWRQQSSKNNHLHLLLLRTRMMHSSSPFPSSSSSRHPPLPPSGWSPDETPRRQSFSCNDPSQHSSGGQPLVHRTDDAETATGGTASAPLQGGEGGEFTQRHEPKKLQKHRRPRESPSSLLWPSFLRRDGDSHGDGGGDSTEPTDAVLRLATRGDDWPALLSRLRTHPADASYYRRRRQKAEGDGNEEAISSTAATTTTTPLHEACYHRHVPADVVRALLRADPCAAWAFNRFDKLPLHVACWHGVGYASLRALLEAYPPAAAAVDGRGRTPIKSLWAGNFGNNSDLALMNSLAGVTSPTEFAVPVDDGGNDDGESSDAAVGDSPRRESTEYYSDSDDEDEEDDDDRDPTSRHLHRRRRMGDFWLSAVLLLDTAHNRVGDDDGASAVVARHLPPDHPLLVLRAASALSRMDRPRPRLSPANGDGTIASMDGDAPGPSTPGNGGGLGGGGGGAVGRQMERRSNSRSGLDRLVSRLLPAVLADAGVPIPCGGDGGGRGRFLLHLAAEDGLTWEVGGGGEEGSGDGGGGGDMGIVERVLRAHPVAVSEGDAETGLHPFMLSAAAMAGDRRGRRVEIDDASRWSQSGLETVFNLLLADPSLVMGATGLTRHD